MSTPQTPTLNTSPQTALDLAAKFQVVELEPRLENVWARETDGERMDPDKPEQN